MESSTEPVADPGSAPAVPDAVPETPKLIMMETADGDAAVCDVDGVCL
jgi:hypothetical protein